MWVGGQSIDWFPKGPLRVDARSVHILLGTLLALLLIYRLFWRATGGTRVTYARSWSGTVARLMHGGLYLALLGTLSLGLFNAWIRGDSLFGLARIAAFGSYDAAARHALSERIVGYHSLGANLILLMAGAHAAAALVHQLILKDNLIARMAPRFD
jgi:cytochrome b561